MLNLNNFQFVQAGSLTCGHDKIASGKFEIDCNLAFVYPIATKLKS